MLSNSFFCADNRNRAINFRIIAIVCVIKSPPGATTAISKGQLDAKKINYVIQWHASCSDWSRAVTWLYAALWLVTEWLSYLNYCGDRKTINVKAVCTCERHETSSWDNCDMVNDRSGNDSSTAVELLCTNCHKAFNCKQSTLESV